MGQLVAKWWDRTRRKRDIEQKLVKAVKGWGSAVEIKAVRSNIHLVKMILHELRRNLSR